MELKRILLLIVIIIILIICILLNNTLSENFTSSSRTLINDVDTLLFNHISELDNKLEKEPQESDDKLKVDIAKFEGQANRLLKDIIGNIEKTNLNKINIELDTTDFGNKCLENKTCSKDEKTDSYKCFVKLKDNDFRVGRKIVKQSCDKLLNNTRNHVVNLNSFRLENRELFKNLLLKIDRVFNTYNTKIDLLIEQLKQKEDNIRQQSYFERNNINSIYMNKKNIDKMDKNIAEKRRNSNNNFTLLEAKKEKIKEYDSVTSKFIYFTKILLLVYTIILFVIISKKKIEF